MMKSLSARNMKLLRVWLGVCLNLPKEDCSLVHHFMRKEEVLKMEQHHQSITITHSKVNVLRSILDEIFMKKRRGWAAVVRISYYFAGHILLSTEKQPGLELGLMSCIVFTKLKSAIQNTVAHTLKFPGRRWRTIRVINCGCVLKAKINRQRSTGQCSRA
jgi:predicted transcriptional regulator